MAIVFITAFACSCGWFKKPDNNGNGGNNGGEIVNPNPDPNPDPKPEDKPKPGDPHPSAVGLPDRRATEEEKILNFATGRNDAGFWAADGWSNNGMFNCTWSRNNAVISDGLMNMSITKGNDNRFYGGGIPHERDLFLRIFCNLYETREVRRNGFFAVHLY